VHTIITPLPLPSSLFFRLKQHNLSNTKSNYFLCEGTSMPSANINTHQTAFCV
jgi:hypothetical protein